MYIALKLASVALFWASAPLLLLYRARRSDVPWVFVIVAATALGWILSNAAVFFQHAAIDEERLEELACFTAPYENKSVTVVNADGTTETTVENPCGIGEWLRENYKPWMGLLYGPLYLICCTLPYWLIVVRRAPRRSTWQIASLAVAVLLIEWAGIFRECTAVFGDRTDSVSYDQVCNYVDPYTSLPLTIAAAFLVSWVVRTQLLQRFGRQG